MDTVFSILFIVIILVILILPIFLIYLLWAKVKFGKYLAVVFVCFISYQVYITLNPPNSFYMAEYQKITKQEFPKSGKIIKKYASLPDIHGDYESCAIIELSENDYKILKVFLENTKSNEKEYSSARCNAEWVNEKGTIIKSLTYKKDGGSVSMWGLIKDKNHVFISYDSGYKLNK